MIDVRNLKCKTFKHESATFKSGKFMNSDKQPAVQTFLTFLNIFLLLLYVISALYLAFGLSANSNAFDSPDTYIVLIFLVITIPHACLSIFAFIKKGRKIRLLQLSGLAGLFFIFGGFSIGVHGTKILVQETKTSGDIILENLSDYVSTNGYCPKSLDVLAKTGVTLSKPSIKKSTFKLKSHGKTCTLSFAVDFWVTCRKKIPNPNNKDWYCVD